MNKMPVNPPSWRNYTVLPLPNEVKANAWAVDAACSGNPGPMEYQCIDLQTGEQVFHLAQQVVGLLQQGLARLGLQHIKATIFHE